MRATSGEVSGERLRRCGVGWQRRGQGAAAALGHKGGGAGVGWRGVGRGVGCGGGLGVWFDDLEGGVGVFI